MRATAPRPGIARRMRSPITGCWRMISHSRSSSGPGLCRISSGTPTLPMSCSSAAVRMRLISSPSERERLAHPRGQVDDALGVVTRVAVALLERRGERGDHVAVAELERRPRRSPGSRRRPRPAGRRRRGPAPAPPAPPRARDSGFWPASSAAMPTDAEIPRIAARLEVLELDQDPLDRLHAPRRPRSPAAGSRTRRRPSGRRGRARGSARRSGAPTATRTASPAA